MIIKRLLQGASVCLVAFVFGFSVMSAEKLTTQDMQEIDAFQSDLAVVQGQSDVFKFALKKIKANPNRVEAILKSLNLWDKL